MDPARTGKNLKMKKMNLRNILKKTFKKKLSKNMKKKKTKKVKKVTKKIKNKIKKSTKVDRRALEIPASDLVLVSPIQMICDQNFQKGPISTILGRLFK